jgi:histidine triad (HIT) family protein
MVENSAEQCVFCEIVQLDDANAREVYRNDHIVAFFPTEPAVLGHTMIIPRLHIPDIWSLPEHTAHRLTSAALIVAGAIRRAMKPDGLNIIQSNGEAATQTVMHLHVHLVPRYHRDSVGRIWPPESNYSEIAKDAAWDLIRSEMPVSPHP